MLISSMISSSTTAVSGDSSAIGLTSVSKLSGSREKIGLGDSVSFDFA